MALLRFLGALAFLLLQVARCNLLDSRDYALGPGEIKPIPDIKYERPGNSMPLNGRDLVLNGPKPAPSPSVSVMTQVGCYAHRDAAPRKNCVAPILPTAKTT